MCYDARMPATEQSWANYLVPLAAKGAAAVIAAVGLWLLLALVPRPLLDVFGIALLGIGPALALGACTVAIWQHFRR
jgi:hypothetical protein